MNMTDRHLFRAVITLTVLFLLGGCTSLLPTGKDVIRTPWNNFQEIQAAYNKVTPNATSVKELKSLGFDLYSTPNVKILNHLDIAGAAQNIKYEDLSAGMVKCIKARENCVGYQFEPKVMKSERTGNFWLDIFNFRRKTRGTGWRFKAVFLVMGDIVVDKFWDGDPAILEETDTKNPLGPFQDTGGLVPRFL